MAIALSKEKVRSQTGLTLIYSYLTLFVVNTLVVYLASLLFPTSVVLGTYALTPFWALMLSVGKLTLISTALIPLVYYYEWKRGKVYSPKEWMILYFVVDTLAIWLIARFADKIGFGISHWYIALLLGAALDWAQGMGMMALAKLNK